MATRLVACLSPLYFDESSYIGGGERHPLNLASGVVLGSRGRYRVEMISFGETPQVRTLMPGVTLRVLPIARRPDHPLDVLSWDLPAALSGADVVHIHQAFSRCAEMGLLVARLLHKPVCVTDHGGYSSPLGAEIDALALADRIVPNSDFAASLLKTSTPITVVKGGVDADYFRPPAIPARDRILFVGRLLPHKGIDVLIEALPSDLPLTICGRAYHEAYFRRLQELALGKRVEFLTDADDATIRDLYGRAWVNVLPSVHRDCYGNVHRVPELMGLTLLEAMACGTPVLCSRVGGMPEFVRHGETGFVFDNPGELTTYLRRLANDPEQANQMGRLARQVVEQEYDLVVAGSKLATLYDELLERSMMMSA